MDQRTQFMADYLRGLQTVTELAARCGISRKTAYKWIDRYNEGGPSALPASQRRIAPWRRQVRADATSDAVSATA